MINLIHTLETCWYVSPPWGKEIPPLEPIKKQLLQFII
ncbi:DUF1392 family protein [Nostoc sp. UIC 10630]|nr:DUF1392 family protein [Nostoc sp. UIC 10630]NEU83627.1 DUF1392 domain-containing protein [Nostoc sp. UIC 10630]